MREQRIPWSEVGGRDRSLGEERDVGPGELRPWCCTASRNERLEHGIIEAGSRTRRRIEDDETVALGGIEQIDEARLDYLTGFG